MENKVEPRILPGFMELLPADQVLFNSMVDTIRKSYEKFGFLPLDTPVLELAEVLLAKAGGETEKQIYRIDKGEDSDKIVMRFDLTVPLARFVAKNSNDITFPFRRYQIGKVYRGERPQKGRYREFYQCDIDIIGDGELPIINDAELPSVIYNTFKELGFDDFVISMNNRKILNGLFAYAGAEDLAVDIMRIIDKFDKIGQAKVETELKELGLSDTVVSTIIKFILISGTVDEKIALLEKLNIDDATFIKGLEELKEVVKYVRILGVPDTHFTVDLKIARGLDYYTGTVYETFLTGYREIGSVCSGGRYENLAEFYTDKKLPGVGISIGLTRLFYKLQELELLSKENSSIADVLVMSMDEQIDDCLEIATYFRSKDIKTEVYFANKKFKAKMKYANRLQVPYIVILGEEERKQGKYTLKNMTTGEQEMLTKEEIVEKIK